MISSLFNAFTLLGSEWVLWILMLTSVISIGVAFERWRALSNQERLGSSLWKEHISKMMMGEASAALGKGPESISKAKEISAAYPCLEGRLLEVLAQHKGNSATDTNLVAASFIGKEKLTLEKHLAFLGTVGSNAPFIGLFGTVLGIIKAFHDLGAGQVAQAASGAAGISTGISEALVATAVGLLVAIPAVIFYNYFQRKIRLITGRAESLSNFILSQK